MFIPGVPIEPVLPPGLARRRALDIGTVLREKSRSGEEE
jgi:hypothetical protein